MKILTPTRDNLDQVAIALLAGNHAVLPTETVYGLAADATNVAAVAKIFEIKGRPTDNPLIVHVSSLKQAEEFVVEIPEVGHLLAEAFMPGPLTLVMPKRAHVSDVLTGGLDTVAIRMPDHPACLGVMELGNLALAMPSANRFMGLSPTRASMVDPEIGDQVFAIVDGGPCIYGIESTVLDITEGPRILRPGSITQDEIESVLHQKVQLGSGPHRRSPGMYRRHYAPRTPCHIVPQLDGVTPGLSFAPAITDDQIQMPLDPGEYARVLYAALAEMDAKGLTSFVISAPPEDDRWTAVWDRLSKATV